MSTFDEKKVHSTMTEVLGKGPMRFGSVRRPLDLKGRLLLNARDLQAFIRLEVATERHDLQYKFTPEQIFRVALYHDFNVEKSVRLLKQMDDRYWNVSAEQLRAQLETQTLFPLPSKLTSKDKKIKSFFYMKPSRFHPNETKTSGIIANLLYVMDSLDRYTEGTERNKIGFIANMADWKMENFSMEYCLQFMEALQGKKGPVNVDLFLIVNPPNWFGKIWDVLKPMLSTTFRRKVHMIPVSELKDFLVSGYEKYLPEELASGRVQVDDLVQDFIRYRSYVEANVHMNERRPNKETGRLARPKKESALPRRRASLNASTPTDSPVASAPKKNDRKQRLSNLGRFSSTRNVAPGLVEVSDSFSE